MNEINGKLQKKMSNGTWFDCEDRTEEFFNKCLQNDYRKLTEEKAVEMLNNGQLLHCGTDHYDRCRIKPVAKPAPVLQEWEPDTEEYGY